MQRFGAEGVWCYVEKPDEKSNGGHIPGKGGRMAGREWEYCGVKWCKNDIVINK